jgi:hypothetical protein
MEIDFHWGRHNKTASENYFQKHQTGFKNSKKIILFEERPQSPPHPQKIDFHWQVAAFLAQNSRDTRLLGIKPPTSPSHVPSSTTPPMACFVSSL